MTPEERNARAREELREADPVVDLRLRLSGWRRLLEWLEGPAHDAVATDKRLWVTVTELLTQVALLDETTELHAAGWPPLPEGSTLISLPCPVCGELFSPGDELAPIVIGPVEKIREGTLAMTGADVVHVRCLAAVGQTAAGSEATEKERTGGGSVRFVEEGRADEKVEDDVHRLYGGDRR